MKKNLKQKLRPFFDQRTYSVYGPEPKRDLSRFRYIPRAYSAGGLGWGVWDRLGDRYLSDKETMALTDDELMNTLITQ